MRHGVLLAYSNTWCDSAVTVLLYPQMTVHVFTSVLVGLCLLPSHYLLFSLVGQRFILPSRLLLYSRGTVLIFSSLSFCYIPVGQGLFLPLYLLLYPRWTVFILAFLSCVISSCYSAYSCLRNFGSIHVGHCFFLASLSFVYPRDPVLIFTFVTLLISLWDRAYFCLRAFRYILVGQS